MPKKIVLLVDPPAHREEEGVEAPSWGEAAAARTANPAAAGSGRRLLGDRLASRGSAAPPDPADNPVLPLWVDQSRRRPSSSATAIEQTASSVSARLLHLRLLLACDDHHHLDSSRRRDEPHLRSDTREVVVHDRPFEQSNWLFSAEEDSLLHSQSRYRGQPDHVQTTLSRRDGVVVVGRKKRRPEKHKHRMRKWFGVTSQARRCRRAIDFKSSLEPSTGTVRQEVTPSLLASGGSLKKGLATNSSIASTAHRSFVLLIALHDTHCFASRERREMNHSVSSFPPFLHRQGPGQVMIMGSSTTRPPRPAGGTAGAGRQAPHLPPPHPPQSSPRYEAEIASFLLQLKHHSPAPSYRGSSSGGDDPGTDPHGNGKEAYQSHRYGASPSASYHHHHHQPLTTTPLTSRSQPRAMYSSPSVVSSSGDGPGGIMAPWDVLLNQSTLVVLKDRDLVPDALFVAMAQMVPCRLTPSDRVGCYKVREWTMPNGVCRILAATLIALLSASRVKSARTQLTLTLVHLWLTLPSRFSPRRVPLATSDCAAGTAGDSPASAGTTPTRSGAWRKPPPAKPS
jgi:hypothetical protein